MSLTNRMPDRFYQTAGPALMRWAGLQRLLLGEEGAVAAQGWGERAGDEAPVRPSRPVPVHLAQEWSVPFRTTPDSSVPVRTAPESSVPTHTLPESTAAFRTVPESSVLVHTLLESSMPVRTLAETSVAVRTPPDSPMPVRTVRESSVPMHESSVPVLERSVRYQQPSVPVQASPVRPPAPPAAPDSPASSPMIRGPAAVPVLTGLLEAAARRSRRQHLLVDLAVTQFPTTAPALHQPPEPKSTTWAPPEAPAIRFGPSSQVSPAHAVSLTPARPGPAPAHVSLTEAPPPGTDDFLFEERVRTVVDRILRTDALRHGLALGER